MAISAKFNKAPLDQWIKSLGSEAEKAKRFALSDATRRGRSLVQKELKGLVPASVLKKRLLQRIQASEGKGSVFLGLNPVDLAYLKQTQTARGIKANKVQYEGAFFKKNSPKKSVYMRLGNSRLPIIKVKQDMPVTESESLMDGVLEQMIAYFVSRYEHHLHRLGAI
jgi:hypothetical protein